MNKLRICAVLLLMVLLLGACAGTPAVTVSVAEISEYGHAVLDISPADFEAKGFALGDAVTVKVGDFNAEMPYLDGFYVDEGELLLHSAPDSGRVEVCINYGEFAKDAGVSVNDKVNIALKEKGGAKVIQETLSLHYTNERSDYASDEIFANFRMMTLGGIGENKLYRSASPINNKYERAATSNRLAQQAGVRTVLNLADAREDIAVYAAAPDFDSQYYLELYDSGSVIPMNMGVNYRSDAFAEDIVEGLSFLAARETPYLIHCTEGKDRAGFTAALAGALMGASVEDIVWDYMTSYTNYYHIDPVAEREKYESIAEGNIMEMLRYVAGLEKGASLDGVDMAQAAGDYLSMHGMDAEAIAELKSKLSE